MAPVCRHIAGSAVIAAFGAASTGIAATAFRAAAAGIATTFRAAAAMIAAAFWAATTGIAATAFGATAAMIAARTLMAFLALVAVPIPVPFAAITTIAFSVAATPLGPVTTTVGNDDLSVLADRNRYLGLPGIILRLPDRIAGNTRRRWHRQQGEHDSNRCGTWHPTHVFLPFTVGRVADSLQGKGYNFTQIHSKQIAISRIQKNDIPRD